MTAFTNTGRGKKQVSFASPYPGKIIPVDLSELDGKIICPLGLTSYTGYDSVSNAVYHTEANGVTTALDYNALNNLISVTNDLGDTTSYTYDPVGNRTSQDGASYVYDDANRLVLVTMGFSHFSNCKSQV